MNNIDKKYSISFVMPMYNEKDNISNTISSIRELASEITDDYEIVVVDDASTDNSFEIVEALSKDSDDIISFRLEKNTKFGGAFSKCFELASKDIILYMDSDMPVDKDDIKASLPFINEADIVTGYSKIKKGDTLRRKVISGAYNFIVQAMFLLSVRDINSGYKIVKRSLIKDLRFISLSPFIDVELFIHAKKRGARVRQYPLIFHPRTGGKSYISSPDIILATLRDMIKVRFISFFRK